MFITYKQSEHSVPIRAIKYTGMNHREIERICRKSIFRDHSIPLGSYIIEDPYPKAERTFSIMPPVEFKDTFTEFDGTYLLSGGPCVVTNKK